jgi:uncharacterized membrane protein
MLQAELHYIDSGFYLSLFAYISVYNKDYYMGVRLGGIVAVGKIEPTKEIVDFHWDGNTLIFLDLCYGSVLRFSTICEAGLLHKANFFQKMSMWRN